jgi:hypothetical protein
LIGIVGIIPVVDDVLLLIRNVGDVVSVRKSASRMILTSPRDLLGVTTNPKNLRYIAVECSEIGKQSIGECVGMRFVAWENVNNCFVGFYCK